ncbi:MAG TPA: hypothetical protein DCS07_08940 [Bdellovibrionales bacterium]|nr:MAG: hypothetical protein A2Z97_15150 [Bdellovibrionales bacterium GWB1_52_6]OFZ03895.1 MAG: hypothetical protein A2X97_15970 [Bdellovibrionales bacterium GWA1_52_35]OFZ39472.1 MAG: hypothetical protein A2070_06645 [Bdellovibrionales bacterium GWC1_52_8]HAR42736.1 hypothetical protein [Bdellovibrionales bacterium]HCM39670.1 hypothetical protein [Bdellovibrionales bacterium]
MKFLLVDDDETVRSTVKEYLAVLGFQDVIEAENGVAALTQLRTEAIDLVISDWDMPEMKGIELLKLMKQSPEWTSIPFIIITSPDSHEEMKINNAAIADVDGYIIKPFRVEILREKIEAARAKKSAERENAKVKATSFAGGALVVDDDPDSRDTVAEILVSMGYEPVMQAEDGEKALQILCGNVSRIKVVVSDWEMPNLKGIDLLRALRASEDSAVAGVPFVMVTAPVSVEKSKLISAIDAEVDHYVIKPFTIADLQNAVSLVLKKAKRRQELNVFLNEARQLEIQQRSEIAEQLYRHVIATHPADIRAYAALAAIRMHANGKQGLYIGEQLIHQGISANPLNDRGYLELARLYERIMSLAKAVTALHQGIEICPESAELHFNLGRILLRTGRRDEGIAALQKALKFDKTNGEAFRLLEQAKNG